MIKRTEESHSYYLCAPRQNTDLHPPIPNRFLLPLPGACSSCYCITESN